MKPTRVLILTRNSWNTSNSSGNTLSNFFQDWNSELLAHVYTRDELPNVNNCSRFFKISESLLLENILGKTKYAGERILYPEIIKTGNHQTKQAIEKQDREKEFYDFFRNYRFILILWCRELLWKIARWKSPELRQFLEDFAPDIIFTESYDCFYMHWILNYIHKETGAKIVMFHADDVATFRQFSLSPLFWINRVILRNKLKKSITLSSLNYCITEEQKISYTKIFNKNFKILRKAGSFVEAGDFKNEVNKPVRFIYTGNINLGRWKVLGKVAKSLHKINQNNVIAILSIYSSNPLTTNIRKLLNYPETVRWLGRIDSSEIHLKLCESDVLLHVESTSVKERLITRLSFSTKIVDYLQARRCVVAIGNAGGASIEYFKRNDAGIVVSDTSELESTFRHLIDNPSIILEYGNKAWQCGLRNHQKGEILTRFEEDISIIGGLKNGLMYEGYEKSDNVKIKRL